MRGVFIKAHREKEVPVRGSPGIKRGQVSRSVALAQLATGESRGKRRQRAGRWARIYSDSSAKLRNVTPGSGEN